MAGSKEIRTKIKSVENTRKITRAMEMVAASKMRKAQERMRAARPYAEKIRQVAAHLSRANPEYKHPFLVKRDVVKNVAVIIISSDKAPFQLSHTCTIIPIQVNHYKMPVLGFRIGDFAYITDAKTIAKEESDKLKWINILIINALHQSKHISHFNLEEALAFIELIQPKKAYLTHISHLFGKHNDIQALLPPNVYPAYDGLEIDFNY